MRFSYRLSHLCGTVHTGGNLHFGPDGNTIYSVVHNRVTVFDLVNHGCWTLPYEHTSGIRAIAVSPDSRFLLSVDEGGYLLLVHLRRRLVLCRMRLKRTHKVRDLQFSPDGRYFAVTQDRQFQVWHTPGRAREFAPFILHRTYGSHHDSITKLQWSPDGRCLTSCSKDNTLRVWALESKDIKGQGPFVSSTLSGHRDSVVGAFWGAEDGSRIYSVARDGFIFTWEREAGDESAPWKCIDRQAFKRQERHSVVSSCDLRLQPSGACLLVVGFSTGIFGIYELPDCAVIHTLSVSHGVIGSVCLNKSGEWLALGCAGLGQLLVWEWQSETYVLKQQGHGDALNTLAYSPDGQLIATGGEDSKVKLWSTSSGFSHVTFSAHTAPVTGLAFLPGSGQALLSCSLDGTVRAHDLIRYKNFRTLTTPAPAQLTCVAVDPSGEVVVAGALEPFEVYVWALQTGRLLDVLSGHGGPVVALDFNPQQTVLATGSWDGTVKLWNVYKNELIETYTHNSDVLAVAFRPDGKQLCVATLSGLLSFWDTLEGKLEYEIDGSRDISGGRAAGDKVTAKHAAKSKHFTSVTYTADGACVLAGGRSRFVCIYHVGSKALVKKFQVSHDRRLDGVLDELHSGALTEGGPVEEMALDDSDEEGGRGKDALPGAKRKEDGSRNSRLEARTTCVRFSGTGLEWAAASPLGLLVYALDDDLIFDPLDLDEEITPASIRSRLAKGDYAHGLMMAVQLNEEPLLIEALESVPYASLGLVTAGLAASYVPRLLQVLAKLLSKSPHVQYLLHWARLLLQTHGTALRKRGSSSSSLSTYRSLYKSITTLQQDVGRHADNNMATLDLLAGAALPTIRADDMQVDDEDDEEDALEGLGDGELLDLLLS